MPCILHARAGNQAVLCCNAAGAKQACWGILPPKQDNTAPQYNNGFHAAALQVGLTLHKNTTHTPKQEAWCLHH